MFWERSSKRKTNKKTIKKILFITLLGFTPLFVAWWVSGLFLGVLVSLVTPTWEKRVLSTVQEQKMNEQITTHIAKQKEMKP